MRRSLLADCSIRGIGGTSDWCLRDSCLYIVRKIEIFRGLTIEANCVRGNATTCPSRVRQALVETSHQGRGQAKNPLDIQTAGGIFSAGKPRFALLPRSPHS